MQFHYQSKCQSRLRNQCITTIFGVPRVTIIDRGFWERLRSLTPGRVVAFRGVHRVSSKVERAKIII